ncbi:unnamed protein product [Blepharisma stoltei]|uniref:Uncharacterized protein n=1 Tax=Blepharisma stoltei TaxID=1481888 RepID=A0AAU9JP72_9CILI|nr:unnamed protein product [Blepharisma stoltei]
MLHMRILRRFASSPWTTPSIEKRVNINHQMFHDDSVLSFVPLKARFAQSGGTIYLKSKGVIILEFLPKDFNQAEGRAKINPANKKTFTLQVENIYDYVSIGNNPVEWRRHNNSNDETKLLKFFRSEGGYSLKLEILNGNTPVDKKEFTMTPSEYYITRQLLEYSIPYLMGWYPLGDPRLAENSLAAEEVSNNPFESI